MGRTPPCGDRISLPGAAFGGAEDRIPECPRPIVLLTRRPIFQRPGRVSMQRLDRSNRQIYGFAPTDHENATPVIGSFCNPHGEHRERRCAAPTEGSAQLTAAI